MKKTKLNTKSVKKTATKKKVASKINELRASDVKKFDFTRCTQTLAAKIFGFTEGNLRKWIGLGAPKNDDTTVSIKELVEWKVDREIEKVKEGIENLGVKDKLVAKRTEKLDIEIDKLKGQTITKERARELFERQVFEVRYFLTESYKINMTELMRKLKVSSKHKEVFGKEFSIFTEEAINAFAKNSNGEDVEF